MCRAPLFGSLCRPCCLNFFLFPIIGVGFVLVVFFDFANNVMLNNDSKSRSGLVKERMFAGSLLLLMIFFSYGFVQETTIPPSFMI